jgi:hypothetical protein
VACSTDGSGDAVRGTATSAGPTTTDAAVTVTVATAVPGVPVPRVLLVGDSTLMALEAYDAVRALRGFDFVLDAKSCRTLGIRSCGRPPRPPNAAETIAETAGTFDDVVIMAGYDEWYTSFPGSFDKVVQAARAKGVRRIVWLTYRESMTYLPPSGVNARDSFIRNNRTLRAKLAGGGFPEVVLADWDAYTDPDDGWIHRDGVHLTESGALLVADYISRWVAFVHGLACPGASTVIGPLADPCADPDSAPPPADIAALYRQ